MDIRSDECHLYWQSVVDTMAEGLFIVDTAGIVVFINPAAERITGYRREEVLGRPCSAFESETCLACRRDDGGLACGLFEQGRVVNRRCTVRRKDGGLVHLLKNAVILTDAHGRVIGGVETLSDISEVVNKDRQISGLRRELNKSYGFEGLIGESKPMAEVFALLDAAAQSTAPVVILGESGTGKELAAAAIHRRSPRRDGPFIKVNCAALNESLLESELFGHEKGAFTGAERQRKGRFEAAHGGSIFLDEIGDLPPQVQVKLLRVLQEGEIERVGSQEPIKLDVRVISATNQDLGTLVAQGKFREDLYYRINVIPIRLPPLRQRREDIPLLVRTFTERMALRSGRAISGLSRAALERLLAHDWPGNVRELINAMEYAFVTCREGEIQPHHLPATVLGLSPAPHRPRPPAPASSNPADDDEAMRQAILRALETTGGRKAKAAELLGVSRVTFWKRARRLGLEI
ncbi:MAG: sigma 54-interacting transcriptional regulator [Desulfarculus sp.]|nr:sigma 54-interacting transcriptional regulator [Desulfarculus sp.]